MRYAVEYNVYSTKDNKKFDGVFFKAEQCIDNEEFDTIVKGKKDIIVKDFRTYGSHTNEDKSETEVIYTRGYIETKKGEEFIMNLIKDNESKRISKNETNI